MVPSRWLNHPANQILICFRCGLPCSEKPLVPCRWHGVPLWGTPHAVYGTLTTSMDVSETSVRQFLSSHAALLKVDQSLPGLRLTRTVPTPGGTLYRFSQSVHDVPVYGAEVSVFFDKQGRIVALTNTAVPNAILATLPPTVSEADAVNKA